jgi:hypothetical protein
MASLPTTQTSLQEYVELDDAYFAAYEAYEPDSGTLMRINMTRAQAHVVIPSRRSCSDCARNLPQMARIAERLPDWSWEVFNTTDNAQRSADLKIMAVPTFIVYDHEGGRELGRIVENPASGSLEKELLRIVQSAR